MTPQKQKKSQNPWIQCDKCLINLLQKDCDKHHDDCPPNLNQIRYNFVKDETLFGTIDLKSNEEIKNLTPKEKDNLLFLSQSVIQLCNLSIGALVSVQSLEDEKKCLAKIVWPTLEKTLTSALLIKNGFEMSGLQINEQVKVEKIEHSFNAKIVTLQVLNAPKSMEITQELIGRLKNTFENYVLLVNNKLHVMFYGKVLKFEVKSIEGDENSLESKFEGLTFKEKHKFFKINKETKWNLINECSNKVKARDTSFLAGVDKEMAEIRNYMRNCFEKPSIKCALQIKSVLIYGNSGTGKTSTAKALCQEFNANTIVISSSELYSKNSTSVEDLIKELFVKATISTPSVIILDEIDILCPARTSSRLSDSEKRIVSTLLLMLDNLDTPRVFIIATTSKPDAIDPAFRRYGRLDKEIEIPTPSPVNRRSILTKFLEKVPTNLTDYELHEIANLTHGFVGSDLISLCTTAVFNANSRNDTKVEFNDFKSALKTVRPSAMREVQIEIPNVKWTDIGGQEKLKLTLKQSVEWPLKYAKSFKNLGITPPKGVLMFGPPGCSKTMIAKALATESGLNFLSIKGPELFSKWVGESERAVREVFKKARQVAPSIIFFDEIDALGGERTSGTSTSVQERVLAQLLTELDGISPLSDVTIVAATNRPDRIDKALLRPGRLDRIVYVPLPDESTRRDIFKIKLQKMPVVDVNVEELVKKTEKYSGAEVNAVCHEAAMMALEENIEASQVEMRHFEAALKLVNPRTPQTLIKLYDDYLK